MQQLFAFLYRTRVFSMFILLQVVAGILIVNNNSYQGAAFFTSANSIVGTTYELTTNVSEYLDLKEVNQDLAEENAYLKDALQNIQTQSLSIDSLALRDTTKVLESLLKIESGSSVFSHHIAAKVINNSVLRNDNYITINKGTEDGIHPGMGVITAQGVVGQVKSSSKNFASCYSLLHSQMIVSSEIQKINALCSTVWDTSDPKTATVKYLARHLDVAVGDTVISSGYNTVYPEGVMIGIVNNVEVSPKNRFLKVSIDLSEDFSTLSYVYVTDATLRTEKDSLEVINSQE